MVFILYIANGQPQPVGFLYPDPQCPQVVGLWLVSGGEKMIPCGLEKNPRYNGAHTLIKVYR